MPRGLAARVYAISALTDAIPIYPVYPVLFADHGLSTAQISALFVLWSATGVLLNIPAGALADRVSRRLLLSIGALLRAVGYALWTAVPSFAAFAAGFVLWGAGSSLQSGTFEALVYDELDSVGATDGYGRLTGRSGTISLVVSAAASALAIPLLGVGGFQLVGWISAAVCVAESVVSLSMPARPRAADAGSEGGIRGYARTLHAGIAEAATHPLVRGPLLLAALLPALTAIDEYVPLLGHDYHVPTSVVPVFLLAITVTAAIGNWCAGRWWSLSAGRMALTLAAGAVMLAVTGLTAHPAGFTGVALAFGVLQFAIVGSQVRLQHTIAGPARATVTSVADVGADVGAIAVFGASALVAQWLPVTGLLAAYAVPLLLLAIVTPRWLRTGSVRGGSGSDRDKVAVDGQEHAGTSASVDA
ncbi:MAG TPA: MFS transporter [Micromonosporaceae bacterium]|nr:MFS transporter [Micromonosporaceae bacterium]